MSEHDAEPVRGLPGALPAGETLLWQGAPRWATLACEAFHLRAVAVYFSLLLAWRAAGAIGSGATLPAALVQAATAAPLAGAALGLLALWAWLVARTTVYSITSRRVVLRYGVALSKAINLPFTIIESGALKAGPAGTGDLALTLKAPNKLAIAHLWPHARPWRLARPQPSLRAVPDAAAVARTLATAMKAEVGVEIAPLVAPARATPKTALGLGETATA